MEIFSNTETLMREIITRKCRHICQKTNKLSLKNIKKLVRNNKMKHALITGGLGFIGSN